LLCWRDEFFSSLNNIRIFDYPRFAETLRNALRDNAEQFAKENGLEIEFFGPVGESHRNRDGVYQPAELGFALKSLPVGTAYAVWVGIGAIGTAILGIALFHEPVTIARLLSLTLILAGIVGLKFTSPQ